MSTRVGLVLVGVAGLAVVAFFFLSRRTQQTDPLLTGVNGLVGGIVGWGDKLLGTVGSVVGIPVRVANDIIGGTEKVIMAPVNVVKDIWGAIF